ncbi:MAG: hypothetical protein AB1424_09950 [Thermodesulfobacteriota bacterium]
MSVETEKWLTLSEVIHKANLDASEARRLVGKFSRFLAARNFGDITKYPPTAADALSLISHLCRQGWNTREIMEILIPTDHQEVPSFPEQLRQELGALLEAQNQAYQSMLATFEMVEDLISDVVAVTARLAAAEKEIQAQRTLLAQFNTREI